MSGSVPAWSFTTSVERGTPDRLRRTAVPHLLDELAKPGHRGRIQAATRIESSCGYCQVVVRGFLKSVTGWLCWVMVPELSAERRPIWIITRRDGDALTDAIEGTGTTRTSADDPITQRHSGVSTSESSWPCTATSVSELRRGRYRIRAS